MLSPIAKNLGLVRDAIERAARHAGRNPRDITLIAVSKTQPAAAVRSAYAAGQHHFGENYLQDALEKMRTLRSLPLCWHFIGSVQSNKTRSIATHFDWVHTVDRLKVARRLSDARAELLQSDPQRQPLQLCLQVDLDSGLSVSSPSDSGPGDSGPSDSGLSDSDPSARADADMPSDNQVDTQRAGIAAAAVADLASQISALPAVRLRGLMTILPQHMDPDVGYGLMARLFERLAPAFELDTLSMGMSADYPAAIAHGATHVRVGTDIFGPRHKVATQRTHYS